MGGGHAELRHYRIVQSDTAHTEHIGIFLNTLHGVDMLFEQVLELECIIVLRHFDRQTGKFWRMPLITTNR